MKIRESNDNDKDTIFNLHQNTFGESEGEAVAKLAIALLADETALPILSLIAELDNKIVGHILFTSVKVDKSESCNAYILAPLAVANNVQGEGIGTALIKEGLDKLKQRAADFVLVLGDPRYYSRTGFSAMHNIEPPYRLEYPEAWMAQELRDGSISGIKGVVKCAVSLNSPEHW